MKSLKLKLILIALTVALAASLAACGDFKVPSIYGDLSFGSDKYTVLFLVEGQPGIVPAQNVEPDTVIVLPEAAVENNVFLGWSEVSPDDRFPVKAGTEYTVRSTVVLFAVFETDNLRTVVFDVKGDTGLVRSKYLLAGTVISLPKAEVASHTFKGWSEIGPDDPAPMSIFQIYTVDRDVTLYAVLEKDPPPYDNVTVKFSVDGTVREDLTCTAEAGSAIALPDASFTKAGHTFVGWTNNEKGLGTFRPYGSKFVANENTVLYAKYISKVSVVFSIAGKVDVIQPAVVTPGTEITLPADNFEGYKLIGWCRLSPDELLNGILPETVDPAVYLPGSLFTVNENTFLYAVIKEKVSLSFKVEFNGIDYNADETNVPKMHLIPGETVKLPALKQTVAGYTLTGWHDGESGVTYKPGLSYTFQRDTVLTAQFEAQPVLTFSVWHNYVDYNDGGYNASPIQADAGTSVTLPALRYDNVYGYGLIGWSAASPNDPSPMKVGSKYTLRSDTTLFAVFGRLVTLTFDVNGNTSIISSMTAPVGSEVSLRSGSSLAYGVYRFGGWSLQQPFTEMPQTKLADPYKVTGAVTIYPIWVEHVSVYYNILNGSYLSYTQSVARGSMFTLPTPSIPYSTMQVLGWSKTSADDPSPIPTGTQIEATGDMTLYLVTADRVTASFYLNDKAAVSPVSGARNAYIELPGLPAGTVAEGYEFMGWSLRQNLTGTLYRAGAPYKMTADTVFYAKLTKAQVTVSFSVNGSVVPSLTQPVITDSQIVLPVVDVPDKILRGWSLKPDFSGTLYKAGEPFTVTAANTQGKTLTLYAKLDDITADFSFSQYTSSSYYLTAYHGSDAKVTVPSVYHGYPVAAIGDYAFYGNETVVSVTLPESVKTIRGSAFQFASNLENINLEYVDYIGSSAFYYASKLKLASLNTIDALTYIGYSAFGWASTQAADRTTPFVLTPKIQTVDSYVFEGWTPDMSVNITAVNKRFENREYWAGNATVIDNYNGQGFAFQYDEITETCTIIGYPGGAPVMVIPEQVYFAGRFYKVTAITENALSGSFTKVVMGAAITQIIK